MLKRRIDKVEYSAVAKRMVIAYFPVDLGNALTIKIDVAW